MRSHENLHFSPFFFLDEYRHAARNYLHTNDAHVLFLFQDTRRQWRVDQAELKYRDKHHSSRWSWKRSREQKLRCSRCAGIRSGEKRGVVPEVVRRRSKPWRGWPSRDQRRLPLAFAYTPALSSGIDSNWERNKEPAVSCVKRCHCKQSRFV